MRYIYIMRRGGTVSGEAPAGAVATTLIYWLPLVTIPALLATAVAFLIPFTAPLKNYLDDALALSMHGSIRNHFLPVGYSVFLAGPLALLPLNIHSVVLLVNILLHVAIAITLGILLTELGVPRMQSLAAALLLQLHPDLLLSVAKLWDVPYSTELLLLCALSFLRLLRPERTLASALFAGLALGMGILHRPNLVVISLALFYAAFRSVRDTRSAMKFAQRVTASGVVLAVAAATFASGSLIAFHRIEAPHNGAYNLFAGHNAFTRGALLNTLNAESSLYPALIALHRPDIAARAEDEAMQPAYSRLAFEYAVHHPLNEAFLPFVKLFTVLRPDLRQHGSATAVVKVILALPVPLWAIFVLRSRRRLRASDVLICCIAGTYIVPFLLTNADPRFRLPLDTLLLAHTIALCLRRDHEHDSELEVNERSIAQGQHG